MRGRASLGPKISGPRRNFLSLFSRFLEICKFVWPLLIFAGCSVRFPVEQKKLQLLGKPGARERVANAFRLEEKNWHEISNMTFFDKLPDRS